MPCSRAPIAAIAAALLLALIAAPARAAEALPAHNFLFELHGFIKEPGQVPVPPPEGEYEDACGLAVDSYGDIYLSDYYHHVIDLYSPTREYLTQIADPDPDGPCNLAVDSAGHLYVNHWHRDVARYTPSAYPPSATTTYGAPTTIDSARSTGVAIDPATDNLYINDRTYIAVYDPSGNPIEDAEGQPLRIGLDPTASYYGLAVSDFPATKGEVYLADASDEEVKAFDPATSTLTPAQVIDGAGTPQRGFHSLADSNLAIDQADGHLFVADNLEPGFSSPAAVVDEFNSKGAYRGQLPHALIDAEPTALAVDGASKVYVSNGNSELAAIEGFGPTLSGVSLTLTKTGTGEGTLSSTPAGINCASACAAEYNVGQGLTLTAVPAPGSVFAGWSAAACPGTGACQLSLAANTEVSAEFEALPPQPASAGAIGSSAAAIAGAGPLATESIGPPAPRPRAERGRHHHKGRHLHRKRGRG